MGWALQCAWWIELNVAVCCSVLQCVAVCCSVLQCVAVRPWWIELNAWWCVALCCSVLQCVAVCCSMLQYVAVRRSVLQCVALRCRILHCVAVYCSESYHPPMRQGGFTLPNIFIYKYIYLFRLLQQVQLFFFWVSTPALHWGTYSHDSSCANWRPQTYPFLQFENGITFRWLGYIW